MTSQNTLISNLTTQMQLWAESDEEITIILLDHNHETVGALYLDKLKYRDLKITEIGKPEKFYLYIDGVGIYFSYFKKIA